MYENGIGAWPDSTTVKKIENSFNNTLPSIIDFQNQLQELGYNQVEASGEINQSTIDAIISFQLHWRPKLVNGKIDKETAAILEALLLKYR